MTMKKLALLATLTALFSAAALANPASKESHKLQPDLSWVQPFGAQGPAFGFVEGKFGDSNPASFFVKFPAGGDSGWHVHNHDYSAVVIQGTFTEQQAGDKDETQLPPGTFMVQPAKITHRNGCLKGSDCIVYVHFDKGADSTPTTREGKAVTPPAPAKK
jgi:quercetin dioxygenase-like cupin family protein